MFKYCYNCWEKNKIDSDVCTSCGNSLNEDLNSKIIESQKLFNDKKFLLKHGMYGLLFAEKTLNANFNEETEYTKIILQMLKNIENEINNSKTIKSEDLTDYSKGRYFSLEKIDVKVDNPQLNLLKFLPLIYLKHIKGDIIGVSKKGPFKFELYNEYYSLFNLLTESSDNNKYYNYFFAVLSNFISFITHQHDDDKLKELGNLSNTTKFIIDSLDGNTNLDNSRTEKYLKQVLSIYEEYPKIKRIFEGSRSIGVNDFIESKGIVNTFFAVIYALNQNSFEECIKTAILHENEFRITTVLTGIIAGCYYHIDENFNAPIPIFKKDEEKSNITESLNVRRRYNPFDSNSNLTFKSIFLNQNDFENYLNNFENVIMKDQIRIVTRFRDFFKDAKKSDCYGDESVYPKYPEEMHSFHYSSWVLEDSKYVHSNYDKVYSKYKVNSFDGTHDEKRLKLVKIADFNSLKIMLNEYLRAEHMCEGWWTAAIEQKLFYQIILRLEEYSNFINVKDLEVPDLLFEFKNNSFEEISEEDETTESNLNVKNLSFAKDKVDINVLDDILDLASFDKYKNDILITLVGMSFYYGDEPFKIGNELEIIKEPDNDYDMEAIYVKSNEYGKVGYVANDVKTVHKNTYSAGRIYEKIGHNAKIEVIYIGENEIIAKLIR